MTKDIALKILGALLLVALVVALVFGTVHGYELWRAHVYAEGDTAGADRVLNLWNEDRAKAQAAAIENDRLAAAETLRRLTKQKENDDAQQALLVRVAADRDRARAAAGGLQLRASAYLDAAGCSGRSGDSALECVRAAAAAIGDALGRSGEIARRAAADADEARARGLKCEADYDALSAPR
jgi:uncharacterized protein GlcG (DUF336 family)